MIKIFVLLVASLVLNSVLAISLNSALSVVESNEKIKKSILDFERGENNTNFLMSNIFPEINLVGNYSQLGPGDSISKKDTSLVSLNLVQPLFRGLKEFKTIEASKLISKSRSLLVEATKREVKSVLVSEYFGLISTLKERELSLVLLKLSKDRVIEIESRVKIGKSKKADLFTAKSQEYTAQNLIAEIDSRIDRSKLALNYLLDTKLDISKIVIPLEIKNILKISDYESLPVVKSYELLKEVSNLQLKIAKAGHMPSVDLKANYYPLHSNLTSQRDWDASVVLTLPLYEGGKTKSDVYDKALAINDAHYEYVTIKKSISQHMDNIILDFDSSKSRLDLLSKSKKSAKESYEELKKEYNLGLVTNLEVIQSLNQFIDSEKNYVRVFYNYQSSAYRYNILTENI